jgi:hypothetical protein
VVGGSALPTLGNNNFMGMYTGASDTTESNVTNAMPAAGTLKNFFVTASGAVGGTSIVFTVRKGTPTMANTTITCTMTSAQSSCSDTAHSVPFNQGDLISVSTAKTGSTNAVSVRWTAQYAP